MPNPIPIVDSHIHIFPESHLPTLAWHGPSNPLGSQHSLDEYRVAVSSSSTSLLSASAPEKYCLRGFVFLETDRISAIDEPGWTHVLDEVSLLARIALGEPIPGEGHVQSDKDLCLGIIPWGPVPGGPEVLERYMGQLKERTRTDEVWRKVRGVRYLVQDKPRGTMLAKEFVDGLKWLAEHEFRFDLGVDARQGGLWQLEEAVEMMRMVYDRNTKGQAKELISVINHMCKPNLRLPYSTSESITSHPEFLEWKRLITTMARFPTTYMKLSGSFSELPPLGKEEPDYHLLVKRLSPWTDVVFDTFGPERTMFGSDWPVCNVGGGGNAISWRRWKTVVQALLDERGFNEEQKAGVWGEVALKAYGIET